MKAKVYQYAACDTCRKALKYLKENRIPHEEIPIVDRPPSPTELKKMLAHLKDGGKGFKNLFNTSGVLYRELKIGDRLKKGMTEDEALQLLAKNGKLIKRPFVLTDKAGAVGFKPEEWNDLFKR